MPKADALCKAAAAASWLPAPQLEASLAGRRALELWAAARGALGLSAAPRLCSCLCQPSAFSGTGRLPWPLSQQMLFLVWDTCGFVFNRDQDCFPFLPFLPVLCDGSQSKLNTERRGIRVHYKHLFHWFLQQC